MGTPHSPRQPRSNNDGGGVSLSIEAERTIGVVGGIRTDATAELGINAFVRNNRVTGYIDPDSRSGGLSAGIGSAKKGLGGEIGVNAQFNENGSINSIGGNIAGSFLGFGGGIGGSSAGDASISGQAFGIGVEVARDKDGSVTLQTCFSIGIIEACTSFSKDRGDPQNTEGTLKLPRLDFERRNKSPRPRTPNAPTNDANRRKKPQPKTPQTDKPKPNPRPKPNKPDKPKTDKKPQLNTKKKPPVGFGKKPPINPKKPPINPKKPIDPSPINLKKPITPPKVPSPPRPTPNPSPTPPKSPKPAPSPQPSPNPKSPRPSPWPRPTDPKPTPTPTPTPTPPGSPFPKPPMPAPVPAPTYPVGTKKFCKLLVSVARKSYTWQGDYAGNPPYQFGNVVNDWISTVNGSYDENGILTGTVVYRRALTHLNTVEANPGTYNFTYSNSQAINIPIDPAPNKVNVYGTAKFEIRNIGGEAYELKGEEQAMYNYLQLQHYNRNAKYEPSGYWNFYEIADSTVATIAGNTCVLSPKYKQYKSPRLPNKPTKIKPMDCCKELKEIHKYLGIPKLKKDKFNVAKAFMVAGGKGNEECEDYYQVAQSLFRMLANGLIINPIAKPLANDWQVVNASAWAAQVYEMVAEAMSNGNSTQKFEISAIMQMAQLMSTLAETTRKVEYIIDAIGYEPILSSEDVTIPFTIYEGHKGFAKLEPKKIDITKSKTDNEVEAVLAKMLQPSNIPIVSWQFDPNNISISKALRAL